MLDKSNQVLYNNNALREQPRASTEAEIKATRMMQELTTN